MSRAKDLRKRKFGKLTVEGRAGTNSAGNATWDCLCECGKRVVVPSNRLTSGNTRSCGCLRKRLGGALVKDISRQKFGRLTVLERAGSDARSYATWLCQCKCGNKVVVRGSSLRNGNTRSCGCLRKEHMARVGKDNQLLKEFLGEK